MRLFAFLGVFVIATNCCCQDLEKEMAGIITEYGNSRQPDSSRVISLKRGYISVPLLCTNKRTGTIDSERGELKYQQLLINYDIGFMAGTHATAYNKHTFSWYDEKLIGGNKVCIGLRQNSDSPELVMTIRAGSAGNRRDEPANFWAKVRNADEIRQVITTVFSYKPKE